MGIPPTVAGLDSIGVPQARTKEENQERAFIAASRRKDRSLDARLESANRASQLHKKRTGRALAVDRETVEKELMYEEIDDTYRAKMQRYMRLQSAQLSQDFDNSLLAAFPSASHNLQLQMPQMVPPQRQMYAQEGSPQSPSSGSPGQQSGYMPPEGSPSPTRQQMYRRPSIMRTSSGIRHNGPIHGARNMSIDLSQLRNTLPGPTTGSSATTEANFSPQFMTPDQAQTHAQAQAQAQMPAYVADPSQYPNQSQQWAAIWNTAFPGQAMSVSPSQSWPARPEHWPNGQFRNRIASAPTIPLRAQFQAQEQATTAAQVPQNIQTAAEASGPAPARGMSQHVRMKSEPGRIGVPTGNMYTVPFQTSMFTGPSSDSSPSSEPLPTPQTGSPVSSPSPTSIPKTEAEVDMNVYADANASSGAIETPDAYATAHQAPYKRTPPELQGIHLNFGPDYQTEDDDFLAFSKFASTLDQSQDPGTQWPDPFGVGGPPLDLGFGIGFEMNEPFGG